MPTAARAGYFHHEVEAIDLDGDGDLDLWSFDGDAMTHKFSGAGSPPEGGVTYARPVQFPLQSADFNLDGRPDLALGYTHVVLGLTGPKGCVSQWDSLAVPGGMLGFHAVLANPDSVPDLVAHSTAGIVQYLGDGAGGFSSLFHPVPLTQSTVEIADVTGDGWADFLVATPREIGGWVVDDLQILRSDGNGAFGPLETLYTWSGLKDIATGDFNEDGRRDILCAPRGSSAVLLVALPDGSFAVPGDIMGGSREATSLAVGDFDGDGHLDVVCDPLNALTVCLGAGDGTFACSALAQYSWPIRIWSSDIDGDGLPDLVLNTGEPALTVLGNLGGGQFSDPIAYGDSDAEMGVATLDYDGDGVIDLVSARSTGLYVNAGVASTVSVPQEAWPASTPRVLVYPQPMRATGTIRFTLTHADVASVGLYDTMGRLVRVLDRAWMPAGTRSVDLRPVGDRGDRLQSGVYFVRVSTSREQQIAPVVVTR